MKTEVSSGFVPRYPETETHGGMVKFETDIQLKKTMHGIGQSVTL